jgi:hypothetical protein
MLPRTGKAHRSIEFCHKSAVRLFFQPGASAAMHATATLRNVRASASIAAFRL